MKYSTQLLLLSISFLFNACLFEVEAPKNEPSIPTVSYDEETMTRVSVMLRGSMPTNVPGLKDYGFEVAEGGFSTGKIKIYSVTDQLPTDLSCVTTLVPGKHYAIRSYFTNGQHIKYSEEKTFTSPRTSSVTLSDVSYSGGRIHASVLDDGGRSINEVGFCWGKTEDIRIVKRSNKNQAELQDDMTFSFDASLFSPGEAYYLLAYAENSDDESDVIGYSRNLFKVEVSENDFVAIEDDNFEAYLLDNFDADRNGWLSFRELAAITSINVNTDNIKTVKEIRTMPNLKSLSVTGASVGSGLLTDLDVSCNEKLSTLICDNNRLDSLVLSNCPYLDTLSCGGNLIKELDVTAESSLKYLNISGNPLDALFDISYCEALTEFIADDCLGIKTIYVWLSFNEAEYAGFHKPSGATYVIAPQVIIPIPDPYFRKYLIENFDKNGDGVINAEEALQITEINVTTEDISSLSSIEYFPNLTLLYCYCGDEDNKTGKLMEIDVSHNYALERFWCQGNQLEELDVSNNTALTELYCHSNQLKMLDVSNNLALTQLICGQNALLDINVKSNTELIELDCSYNQLTELNIKNNTKLTRLVCEGNEITSLDLSNNNALESLLCGNNRLTSLDIKNLIALKTLWCYSNEMTNLNVNDNIALEHLLCGYNQLSDLDVSCNIALEELSCEGNQLNSIDISKNTSLVKLRCANNHLKRLDISENPNLIEIRCDNLEVPDNTFKQYLIKSFDIDGDGDVSLVEAYYVNAIDICTDEVSSLEGIEAFVSLKSLKCSGTGIQSANNDSAWVEPNGGLISLDISMNRNLDSLECSMNHLSLLDVSSNQGMRYLDCQGNQLERLDISNNILLSDVRCGYNKIASLDVSRNSNLKILHCQGNQLDRLYLSQNLLLEWLNCDYNKLKELDVKNNINLESLHFYSNLLTTIDISSNRKLTSLGCSCNQISNLDVTTSIGLKSLLCSDNLLSELDISNNVSLIQLFCENNNLKFLDTRNNLNLRDLYCDNNSLQSLDVFNNTDLEILHCYNNNLESLNVTNNQKLRVLYCGKNQLNGYLDLRNNVALTDLLYRPNYYLKEIWFKTGQALPRILRMPEDEDILGEEATYVFKD